MHTRIAAATSLAALGVLALAPLAQADDAVDVDAWIKANKEVIELVLDVDVDTCKGLDGLTYDESVRLADAEGIDLKALATKENADQILEYVDNAGITLDDIEKFLTNFCAGKVTPPPPSSEAPSKDDAPAKDDASETPSKDASAPPPGAKDDKSDAPKAEDPNGEMAHTGSDANPFLIGGIGLGAVSLGGGAYFLARKRGIL